MAALFSQVLDMSLTASLIIPAVLAARFFLRRAPKVISYALWAVVLFRLLCPVSFSAPVSVVEAAQPQVTVRAGGTSTVSYLPPVQAQLEPPLPAPALPQPQPDARILAAGIWAAGVTGMALAGLVSYVRLRRRLVGAVHHQGRIYLADYIPTPFVLGILWPRIYIPSHTREEERPWILAHEEHHIRRGDHILKLLAYGALCIHWFNPLVWLAFCLAGRDMEMSCDEAVIRKLGPEIRPDYAQSLLRLAVSRKEMPGMPLAFGGGDTKGRVKNMANWKKPKTLAVLAAAALCILIAALCLANPGGSEKDRDMARCRAALEALQGQESYSAAIHRENYSGALNHTLDSTYHQNGADWLLVSRIPTDGWQRGYSAHGCLYVDGVYYSNNNNDYDKWDENEDILWSKGGLDATAAPWIASFDWDDQKVQYVSSRDEGTGKCIILEVNVPYSPIYTEGTYRMQFYFDEAGNLERLENEVEATYRHVDKEIRHAFTETTQVIGDSPEEAIDAQFQRYLDNQ